MQSAGACQVVVVTLLLITVVTSNVVLQRRGNFKMADNFHSLPEIRALTITATRKIISFTEFVTRTQTIVDSPYCVSYDSSLPKCQPIPGKINPSERRSGRQMTSAVTSVDMTQTPQLEASAGHNLSTPPGSSMAPLAAKVEDKTILELVGLDAQCMSHARRETGDSGGASVAYLVTSTLTQTMYVSRTQPGSQTVTINISGCLPSPMPFNAPTC